MLHWLFAAAVLTASTGQGTDSVPLYDNLGDHHYEITTSKPLAQRYFDQGLRLYYAFNHAEAIRAFNEAARRDPNCAMCYWGTALSYGPNINAPMDSASAVAAYQAIQKAVQHKPHVSPKERALIDALAKRYAAVPPADRAALDSAYANAMAEVVRQYPDDLDALALYAEARMDLRPWNYWTRQGEPQPGTERLVADLERVIAANPNHPGACHFYIHAVEAVYPERAVPCAERLAGLMPGAGHLVHMPGHIYIRVGRYNDAIRANEHAVHADETYITDQNPAMGVYPAVYYPHNYHFLSFAALMAGRAEQAIEAARKASELLPPPVAAMAPDFAPILAYHHLALVTFGRWDEVLALPMPPGDVPLPMGLAHYARGVAFASKGQEAQARAELAKIREALAAAGEGNPKTVLQIATHMLAGEIASRAGRRDEAIREFKAAAAIEDEMMYFEPPLWYYPVRHSLGKELLAAGRAAEAEQAYREDLKRFPNNGWSLFGLAAALEAQGKTQEAQQVRQRFREAWKEADIQLTASRF